MEGRKASEVWPYFSKLGGRLTTVPIGLRDIGKGGENHEVTVRFMFKREGQNYTELEFAFVVISVSHCSSRLDSPGNFS